MAMTKINEILAKERFTKDDIVFLLNTEGDDRKTLLAAANAVKIKVLGNNAYYRGLLEFSNICAKNCFYCGIRRDNKKVERYFVPEAEVLNAVEYAYHAKYASLVIQGGERSDKQFVSQITDLLKKIGKLTNHEMGITLSFGEQSNETYEEWKSVGANRYLIRIETSVRDLYYKLHPEDKQHDYSKRLQALAELKALNYQTGTGVMIGLPFQRVEDLAEDLMFFHDFDVDMVGMGPYIEHEDTPLFQYRNELWPKSTRFDMSLKMIAILRIMMPDINIAASTAMQTLDKLGREKALKVGANVLMPNITPVKYREGYLLYEDKPCLDEDAAECKSCLEARVHLAGDRVAYGEQGNSLHYYRRINQIP
ncbi:MAG: [FeFe] hydrogenase H-cluster radical SAM maturase HydE [Bacteroidales bacterium]|jgi:biotin synthase|nr:[FeFe] hydrogenase H-cluster radical SAM maturase HydE [Bacteroidales bacterium]